MAHMNGVNALGLVTGPAFNLLLAKSDITLLPSLRIDALTSPAWFVGALLLLSVLCFLVSLDYLLSSSLLPLPPFYPISILVLSFLFSFYFFLFLIVEGIVPRACFSQRGRREERTREGRGRGYHQGIPRPSLRLLLPLLLPLFPSFILHQAMGRVFHHQFCSELRLLRA